VRFRRLRSAAGTHHSPTAASQIHARWAMLGALGCVGPEIGGDYGLPWFKARLRAAAVVPHRLF
jgi:hypothetical protein